MFYWSNEDESSTGKFRFPKSRPGNNKIRSSKPKLGPINSISSLFKKGN